MHNPDTIRELTRQAYLKQHLNYSDPTIFERFMSMIPPSYFGVEPDFFRGKTILDAGCGNSGYFQVAMHRYGAAHITCLELGNDWQKPLRSITRSNGVPDDFMTLVAGSTVELPFDDSVFDFVASNGVLIHLASVPEARAAFIELARVTRAEGLLYVILGVRGGLMNKYLLPALRNAYQNEADFKDFIDHVTPARVHEILSFVLLELARRGDGVTALPVAQLFDLDLTTFWQNCMQAPVHLDNELSLEWATHMFSTLGFEIPTRCRRFVTRKNIRKFAAPLHHNLDHPISRMIYGDGCVELIAKKKPASLSASG